MRPEIEELASWYRQDTGAKVASVLAAAIAPLIRRSATARLLALGYCTPFLDGFDPASVERLVLACPAEQGGSCWPSPECNLARSEEHTSELQSLMRISYAVFCLKKKKTT